VLDNASFEDNEVPDSQFGSAPAPKDDLMSGHLGALDMSAATDALDRCVDQEDAAAGTDFVSGQLTFPNVSDACPSLVDASQSREEVTAHQASSAREEATA